MRVFYKKKIKRVNQSEHINNFILKNINVSSWQAAFNIRHLLLVYYLVNDKNPL